jgi:hypothetical protein
MQRVVDDLADAVVLQGGVELVVGDRRVDVHDEVGGGAAREVAHLARDAHRARTVASGEPGHANLVAAQLDPAAQIGQGHGERRRAERNVLQVDVGLDAGGRAERHAHLARRAPLHFVALQHVGDGGRDGAAQRVEIERERVVDADVETLEAGGAPAPAHAHGREPARDDLGARVEAALRLRHDHEVAHLEGARDLLADDAGELVVQRAGAVELDVRGDHPHARQRVRGGAARRRRGELEGAVRPLAHDEVHVGGDDRDEARRRQPELERDARHGEERCRRRREHGGDVVQHEHERPGELEPADRHVGAERATGDARDDPLGDAQEAQRRGQREERRDHDQEPPDAVAPALLHGCLRRRRIQEARDLRAGRTSVRRGRRAGVRGCVARNGRRGRRAVRARRRPRRGWSRRRGPIPRQRSARRRPSRSASPDPPP